ncbi:hypothetical protein F4777DRAFT_78621 [Nemania sp. FL0916]|nr:hypothetical protein F4777DRAFT_78621 [Nemania sp. FL0916]
MYSTRIILSIAALAGTSLSQKSDSQFCSAFFTSFVSIIEDVAPMTPPAILSFLAQSTETETASSTTTAPPLTTLDFASHAQELCEIATELPSSLLPEFQTYAAALLSFGRAYSSDHLAYVSDCAPEDEVASRTSYLNYIFTATGNFCEGQTPTPTPGGASNGTYYPTPTPTATSSYTAGLNSSTTSVVTAAAAKATGVYLGAAALGGILGAAAML